MQRQILTWMPLLFGVAITTVKFLSLFATVITGFAEELDKSVELNSYLRAKLRRINVICRE